MPSDGVLHVYYLGVTWMLYITYMGVSSDCVSTLSYLCSFRAFSLLFWGNHNTGRCYGPMVLYTSSAAQPPIFHAPSDLSAYRYYLGGITADAMVLEVSWRYGGMEASW